MLIQGTSPRGEEITADIVQSFLLQEGIVSFPHSQDQAIQIGFTTANQCRQAFKAIARFNPLPVAEADPAEALLEDNSKLFAISNIPDSKYYEAIDLEADIPVLQTIDCSITILKPKG